VDPVHLCGAPLQVVDLVTGDRPAGEIARTEEADHATAAAAGATFSTVSTARSPSFSRSPEMMRNRPTTTSGIAIRNANARVATLEMPPPAAKGSGTLRLPPGKLRFARLSDPEELSGLVWFVPPIMPLKMADSQLADFAKTVVGLIGWPLLLRNCGST